MLREYKSNVKLPKAKTELVRVRNCPNTKNCQKTGQRNNRERNKQDIDTEQGKTSHEVNQPLGSRKKFRIAKTVGKGKSAD